MRRARLHTAALGVALMVSACTGGSPDDTEPTSAGGAGAPTATVRTSVGSVERVAAWAPARGSGAAGARSFSIRQDGEVVGQMDVLVTDVAPGSPADVVSEGLTTQRLPHVRDLRSSRREVREVPGAESAFLEEHTYTTVDGERARSVDQVAVAPDGGVLLVRLSSAAPAFDRPLFYSLLDSVRLEENRAS